MREYRETGALQATPAPAPASATVHISMAPAEPVDLTIPPPQVPFLGHRIVRDIDLERVYPWLNEVALVRGRWGFRRGNLAQDAYERLLRDEVAPRLERMKREGRTNALLRPQVAYGYFHCRSEGNALWVQPAGGGTPIPLVFPRQAQPPHACVAGFFRPDDDVVGFLVVTLGPGVEQENPRLLAEAEYQDYFLRHGFAVTISPDNRLMSDTSVGNELELLREQSGWDEADLVAVQRNASGDVVNFDTAGIPFSLYSDQPRNTANVTATVTQPLYRGGRTTAATRRAENQVYAQRARLLASEQAINEIKATLETLSEEYVTTYC